MLFGLHDKLPSLPLYIVLFVKRTHSTHEGFTVKTSNIDGILPEDMY